MICTVEREWGEWKEGASGASRESMRIMGMVERGWGQRGEDGDNWNSR